MGRAASGLAAGELSRAACNWNWRASAAANPLCGSRLPSGAVVGCEDRPEQTPVSEGRSGTGSRCGRLKVDHDGLLEEKDTETHSPKQERAMPLLDHFHRPLFPLHP